MGGKGNQRRNNYQLELFCRENRRLRRWVRAFFTSMAIDGNSERAGVKT